MEMSASPGMNGICAFTWPTKMKFTTINGVQQFSLLPYFLRLRLIYDPLNNWLSFQGVNATTSFIFALMAFGAGTAIRPLGALVFGRLGDMACPGGLADIAMLGDGDEIVELAESEWYHQYLMPLYKYHIFLMMPAIWQ